MSVDATALRLLNQKLAELVEMKRLTERLGYSDDKALMDAIAKAEASIKAEVTTTLEA